MTKRQSVPENVTWRGGPKRRWFKRETYTYRAADGSQVQSLPAKWHAGVDIIQTKVPHPGYPDNPMFDKVQMHVRALCGYVYSFDFYLAASHYGRAMYKDEIKSDALRCKKCDTELAKPREERLANKWAVPPTQFHEMYNPLTEGGEPWWPSEK